jgi:hypothetical protein
VLLAAVESEQVAEKEETPLLQIPLFLQMLAVAYEPGKSITNEKALFDAYIAHQLRLESRMQYRESVKTKAADLAYEKIEDEPAIEQTKGLAIK